MSDSRLKKDEKGDEIQEILSDFSQFYILLLLSERNLHGYGIIKEFKKRTGKNLSAGTLYPFLQKLELRGLVSQTEKPVGKKPKNIFSLTKEGRIFSGNLFQRFATMTASAIEPSLETCASCGVKIFEGGYFEEIDGEKLAFCCPHCAKAFKSHG